MYVLTSVLMTLIVILDTAEENTIYIQWVETSPLDKDEHINT